MSQLDHVCITTPNNFKFATVGEFAFVALDMNAVARDFCMCVKENLSLVNKDFFKTLDLNTMKMELETLYTNGFA